MRYAFRIAKRFGESEEYEEIDTEYQINFYNVTVSHISRHWKRDSGKKRRITIISLNEPFILETDHQRESIDVFKKEE